MAQAQDFRILIVEDEAPLAQTLAAALSAEGFVVQTAPDGDAGLRLALDSRPDLLLVDVVMPKKDGLTMLKELRADPWGKRVAVIILTNLTDYKSVSDAVGHNVRDFLVKSDWAIGDIVTTVKNKLKLT